MLTVVNNTGQTMTDKVKVDSWAPHRVHHPAPTLTLTQGEGGEEEVAQEELGRIQNGQD